MNLPPRGLVQLRKGRVSLSGTAYFITKTTEERLGQADPFLQGLLMAEGVPEIIVNCLQWLENEGSIELVAYVIMPDHVHVLFQLGEKEGLQKVMQRFAGFTGRQIGLKLERSGIVWQKGYYDRAIRNEDELQKAYDYIANNPVKAGYVENIIDWPWLYPYPL